MPRRGTILLGFLSISICYLIIVIDQKSFAIVVVMLFIFGVSAALCNIPCLSEIIESAWQEDYDEESLSNVISGIYTQLAFIGSSIGSIVSSYLDDEYGFIVSQSIFSTYLLLFILSYFFFCGMCSVFVMEG